jgi:large subunit ribosomal protein L18e
VKRTGPTSIVIRKLASDLEKASKQNNAKAWARVAELLMKPTRQRVTVNLSKINRYSKEGEMIVVPGKVLGSGKLEKKVTIAAYAFSETAITKIKAAGGEAITLLEAVKRNPQGSNVRIIV